MRNYCIAAILRDDYFGLFSGSYRTAAKTRAAQDASECSVVSLT
jgi:hypothetical protein